MELRRSAARLPPSLSLPSRVVGKSRIAPLLGSPNAFGFAARSASRGPESYDSTSLLPSFRCGASGKGEKNRNAWRGLTTNGGAPPNPVLEGA